MPAQAGQRSHSATSRRPWRRRTPRGPPPPGRLPSREARAASSDEDAAPPPHIPPPPLVLHFAYGANMDPAVLARRGVRPAWASPAVADRDVALAFNHRSAFANLVPVGGGGRGGGGDDDGDAAPPPPWPAAPHGVLYGLNPGDWGALVKAEAGYGVRTVRVVPYRAGARAAQQPVGSPPPPPPGAPITALAFTSSRWATLRAGSLPPRAAYRAKLVAGARARGLDGGYTAWLAGLPVADVTPGRGLPGAYLRTPGQEAVVGLVLGLAGGMLAWGLAGAL